MSVTDSTIADQVVELQQQTALRVRAEVLNVFAAQLCELVATGVPAAVAAPGTEMPDGDLLDAHGQLTTLVAARNGRPAVVVFYRGEWCPYCNVALRAYQDKLVVELDARGVALVAVSPQTADGALTMQEKNELTFAVVSDPANGIAGRLGILITQNDDVRGAQAELGAFVAATNVDGTDTLPMPTVVIIDGAGIIQWIDVHPDFTTRTEPGQILAALDSLELA